MKKKYILRAFPGISPYSKRPAMDKSGLPVYQPSTAAYQQALTMQVQQPFVPVSFWVNRKIIKSYNFRKNLSDWSKYMSPFSSDWPSYCCTKILKMAIVEDLTVEY
ncbi:UNVERIFIED_CONTAM: hypothetical protein NCL1_45171 [Trichonephila clavipes]